MRCSFCIKELVLGYVNPDKDYKLCNVCAFRDTGHPHYPMNNKGDFMLENPFFSDLIDLLCSFCVTVDCKYSTDNGVTWIKQDDTDENDLLVRKVIPCVEFLDEEQDWYWCLVIDYDTGRIENWKNGFLVKAFFKVCDDGKYQIIDNTDNIIWDSDIDSRSSYVPAFLEIDSSNYGDNIYITIDGDGTIKDWDIAKDRIRELLENKQ